MIRKICFVFGLLFLCNLPFIFAQGNNAGKEKSPRLLFFYSPTCHACHKTIQEVMPEIEKEYSGKITIEYLDISDINNYNLMLKLREEYNCQESGVPMVFLEEKIIIGYQQIKQNLKELIQHTLNNKNKKNTLPIPESKKNTDLVSRFSSLGALPIIGAGLIDGINPCAFTVIVFFISFLTLQGYRKKELEIVGASFILAVFLTYVLIGLGLFRFLYNLQHFYFISKVFYYLIALLCFVLFLFSLYDLWLFKKTCKAEDMTLKLPVFIKNRIHSIIGLYYRRKQEEGASRSGRRKIIGILISAFVCGFLVSLLEAVCTGQLYVPTIAFMLKHPQLKIKALLYILLYNVMFVVPLFLVLLFALWGVTSVGFSNFLKKHLVLVKSIMAALFLLFGVIIVFSA